MDVSLVITRPAASVPITRNTGETFSVTIVHPPAQVEALVVHP